ITLVTEIKKLTNFFEIPQFLPSLPYNLLLLFPFVLLLLPYDKVLSCGRQCFSIKKICWVFRDSFCFVLHTVGTPYSS
ncbi:hypothetical protein LINPERHAP1_LOCUS30713, partial [Linum perenne]